MVLDALCPEG